MVFVELPDILFVLPVKLVVLLPATLVGFVIVVGVTVVPGIADQELVL